MNISNTHIYSVVNWKEYLDPTDSTRVDNFLKKYGTRVFSNLIKKIKSAHESDIKSFAILVHPNVSSLSIINKKDYLSVLTHCLMYFKSLENYEKCAEIVKLRDTIRTEIKK